MVKNNFIIEHPESGMDAVCELIQSAKAECSILRYSAGSCSDDRLNQLLIEISNERGCFAFELEGFVERHGIHPAAKLPLRSPFRLAIRQLQALMRIGDTQAVIKECEQHEVQMLKQYGKVLRQPTPGDASSMLRRQYDRIRISIRRLRRWLHQLNKKPFAH